MENVKRWINHSAMSDIGRHDAAVAALPANVGALLRAVQGVIIHTEWLHAYGLDLSRFERVSRDTLPVAERLTLVLNGDSRELSTCRAPAQRTVGTCRDFALMLCAFLRCKGIAARVRCGFADYFNDGWEDHWVCEYWDRDDQCWRLADAQLDELLRGKREVAFDPADLPRGRFMIAGQAWAACRSGECDAARFGHGDVKGAWFVKVNVVRDHYSINNRETSAWDSWRAASGSQRFVTDQDLPWLDDIAARPEQPVIDINPDWTR
jgi:hypothetical protein